MSYRDVTIANIIKVNIFLISLQTQIAEFQVPLRSQYNPLPEQIGLLFVLLESSQLMQLEVTMHI